MLTFVEIEHPSSFSDVGCSPLCHRGDSSSFWFAGGWRRWLDRVRIRRCQRRSRRRKSLWHEIADLTSRPHCYKQKMFTDWMSINQYNSWISNFHSLCARNLHFHCHYGFISPSHSPKSWNPIMSLYDGCPSWFQIWGNATSPGPYTAAGFGRWLLLFQLSPGKCVISLRSTLQKWCEMIKSAAKIFHPAGRHVGTIWLAADFPSEGGVMQGMNQEDNKDFSIFERLLSTFITCERGWRF